jgi:hypothetical protein
VRGEPREGLLFQRYSPCYLCWLTGDGESVVISGRCKVDIHVTKQTKFGHTGGMGAPGKDKGNFCLSSANQQASTTCRSDVPQWPPFGLDRRKWWAFGILA